MPWDARRESATRHIAEAEQLAANAVKTSGGATARERAIMAQAATARAMLAVADAILSQGQAPKIPIGVEPTKTRGQDVREILLNPEGLNLSGGRRVLSHPG